MKSPLKIFIFWLTLMPTLWAQQATDAVKIKKSAPVGLREAAATYRQFKENGILLIKIPTGSKKFAAIEQQMKIHPSGRLKKYYEKERLNLLKMRDSLLAGFQRCYDFSPVVAVYDTSYEDVLKHPEAIYSFMDVKLKPLGKNPLKGKNVLTFRFDRYVFDSNKSLDAYVLTDHKGQIIPGPFPSAIPYKFRRHSLMSDHRIILPYRFPGGIPFNYRNKPLVKFYTRYSWKKVDKNPTVAVVKLMQLKLRTFEEFINFYTKK
jgi:hypothetical protein